MELLKEIETRRAYRALAADPIGRETLQRLALAAHMAPSSMNNQPWRMITVTEPEPLAALRASFTSGNYWALKAPAVTAFVTSADWGLRMPDGRELAWFELGMAAMAYQLEAVHEGLVAHPIVGFDAKAAAAALGLPPEATLVILVVVGKPGDASGLSEKHLEGERGPRIRKPLDEVAAFDAWHERLLPQKG
ncbi:MAG: nitroreductase family protein [Spirochaetales bacterium]|nr:nitroreductase family protein [Spirochaetales bacterium]